MKYFFLSLRPHQWSKNLLVFAAVMFSGELVHPDRLIKSLLTFFLFSFVAGCIYVWNDLKDIAEDRLHPAKKYRPIAAGKIKPRQALLFAVILLVFSFVASCFVSINLTLILILYSILNFLYSNYLKYIVILDILVVAVGYVLRAVAGGVAINVAISPWLLVCTFFLALFLVIGKRRAELVRWGENSVDYRPILLEYNASILDQMISVVTAATIIGYALYTLDVQTVQKFGTYNFIYTVPFVVYGVFRYFYLIYKKDLGGTPEMILIQDRHILINILFWVLTVFFLIYLK